MEGLQPNWRGRFFWLWIAASLCWIGFTAVLVYENVWAPHLKDVSDYRICVADHGLAACSNGIPFEESGPQLPNPYVPYLILGASGPLAILFAWFGMAWVREGSKAGLDDPEK